MAEAEHSLFSASGSDSWGGPCAGKPAMEEGRKTTSEYADEGTAAHELLNWVAQDRFAGGTKTAADWLGVKITVARVDEKTGKKTKRVFTVDQEMAEHVDDALDQFMLLANAAGSERMAEQRVYYHEYLGTPKHLAFGTADLSAVVWDQPELEWEGRIFPAGDELVVADLKYGKGVRVDADTMQLRLYAAGQLWAWAHVANFTRVRLVILQPRTDHFDEVVLTVGELLAEVAKLRVNVPRVIAAMEMAKELRSRGVPDLAVGEELYAAGFLGTSEKGCRFCDAQAVCPAMINDTMSVVSGRERVKPEDFEDLTLETPEDVREYGANYLTAAYLMLDRIEMWSKAVRAEIDRRVLLKGESFDMVKVVDGKKGPRKYIDQGEVELFARQLHPTLRQLMFKQVLLTPAQAEKALKNSPQTWAQLKKHITQSDGKPAVVPLTDTRQAKSHRATVEAFEDLTADTEQPALRSGARAGRDRHPFR